MSFGASSLPTQPFLPFFLLLRLNFWQEPRFDTAFLFTLYPALEVYLDKSSALRQFFSAILCCGD